jgi:hypothetical protein
MPSLKQHHANARYVAMPAEMDRQKTFTETLTRISFLPASQRVDALLKAFVEILAAMDTDTIRNLRDQMLERFSTCGCSFETCTLMIEFINRHLALRRHTSELHPTGAN